MYPARKRKNTLEVKFKDIGFDMVSHSLYFNKEYSIRQRSIKGEVCWAVYSLGNHEKYVLKRKHLTEIYEIFRDGDVDLTSRQATKGTIKGDCSTITGGTRC